MTRSLATPIAHTQRRLDALPARSIVIDKQGDAWQQGTMGTLNGVADGYWYRAYDGEGRSSWDAAQIMGPNVVVLRDGK